MAAGNINIKKKMNQGGSNKRPPIEKGRWAAKGTKPLPEQASIQQVLSVVLIFICRKVLFIATEVKITLYAIALFFGSLLCDFLPIPKIYMSSKDNLFNLYFVKIGWAWTMLVVGAFIYLTSITYGCGHKSIVKRHLTRLIIGTVFWLFWSQFFFSYIEHSTGVCLGKAILKQKTDCIQHGFQWHAFDISGHAFLLVYINLLLVEEAKAILGWEGIRDLLRVEEHCRESNGNVGEDKTTLSALSQADFSTLKENYDTSTPYIHLLFLCMTFISLLSDVMLAITVIYFHTMPQKVSGGIIAVATWYFTYRFWFKCEASPGLPGKGLFPYQHMSERAARDSVNRRQSSIIKTESKQTPGTFMGMPIYGGQKNERNGDERDDELEEDNSRFQPRDFFSTEPRTYCKKHLKKN